MAGGGVGQVKEVTDQEGFISDCAGAAGDEDLDLAAVPPKQLCFLAFLPNILDTKVRRSTTWHRTAGYMNDARIEMKFSTCKRVCMCTVVWGLEWGGWREAGGH